MNGRIGLFYGSSTCYTEMAAEKISACLGRKKVDLFDISRDAIAGANSYAKIILGIPTWDYGELQEDWENIWPNIASVNWQGKTVAIFGLGDQEGYPDWYQDAMGYLWSYIRGLGANCIGLWPNIDYRFNTSQALTDDGKYFVGLALDEENSDELSAARISQWCDQILLEFAHADSQVVTKI